MSSQQRLGTLFLNYILPSVLQFTRSELTFLGDTVDAHTKSCDAKECDQKPKAKDSEEADVNGFHLCTKDTMVTATGAGDRRSAFNYLSDSDKRMQRSVLHTLSSGLLDNWHKVTTCRLFPCCHIGCVSQFVIFILQGLQFYWHKDRSPARGD